jgi:hypothetical protein
MKTLYTICASVLLFTSCERCYECRIMQKGTNQYGQMQSQPPIITEQCGLTRREIRKYVEQKNNTVTVIIGNKAYKTETTVICNEQ